MAGSQAFVKEVLLKNFKDLSFYSGESYDTEAGLIYGFYHGEDVAPTFYYFKDGLDEEKC